MKKIKLPVTWEVCGFVQIEAPSVEAAMEFFNANIDNIPLPKESDYVDGSFALSDNEPDFIKPYNED